MDVTWSYRYKVLVSTTLLETKGASYLMKWSRATYVAHLMVVWCPKPSTLLTSEHCTEISFSLRLASSHNP